MKAETAKETCSSLEVVIQFSEKSNSLWRSHIPSGYLNFRRGDAQGVSPQANETQEAFYPRARVVHSFCRSIRGEGLTRRRSSTHVRGTAQARRRPGKRSPNSKKNPCPRSLATGWGQKWQQCGQIGERNGGDERREETPDNQLEFRTIPVSNRGFTAAVKPFDDSKAPFDDSPACRLRTRRRFST